MKPRPTLFAACQLAVEINKKRHVFLVGAKLTIPLEIGCNVRECPICGAAMSYAYDHYFCRRCGWDESINMEEICD